MAYDEGAANLHTGVLRPAMHCWMVIAEGARAAMQMNLTTIPILNHDGTVVVTEEGRNATQPVLRFTARVRPASLPPHSNHRPAAEYCSFRTAKLRLHFLSRSFRAQWQLRMNGTTLCTA